MAARRPKLLFLTSPNNPDGSMIAEADLLRLLRLPVLVVLDEAYIEFSECVRCLTTCCPWQPPLPCSFCICIVMLVKTDCLLWQVSLREPRVAREYRR